MTRNKTTPPPSLADPSVEETELRNRVFEAVGHMSWFNPFSFPVAQTILLTHLEGRLAPRLLDVGCGNGEFTRLFLEMYPDGRALCVDVDSDRIEVARHRLGQFSSRVEFLVESLEALSQRTELERFDCAFAGNLLHFVRDQDLDSCVKTLCAVLADDGMLATVQFVATPQHLEKVCRAGAREFYRKLRETEESQVAELRARADALRKQGSPQEFAKVANVRHTVERIQAAFLSCGFSTADCVWRMFDSVMLIGVKR